MSTDADELAPLPYPRARKYAQVLRLLKHCGIYLPERAWDDLGKDRRWRSIHKRIEPYLADAERGDEQRSLHELVLQDPNGRRLQAVLKYLDTLREATRRDGGSMEWTQAYRRRDGGPCPLCTQRGEACAVPVAHLECFAEDWVNAGRDTAAEIPWAKREHGVFKEAFGSAKKTYRAARNSSSEDRERVTLQAFHRAVGRRYAEDAGSLAQLLEWCRALRTWDPKIRALLQKVLLQPAPLPPWKAADELLAARACRQGGVTASTFRRARLSQAKPG